MRNETGTVIPSYTVILNAPRLPKKPALTITPFEEKPPTVAQYSERALKDGDGNEISKTYVKKAEIINLLRRSRGNGRIRAEI